MAAFERGIPDEIQVSVRFGWRELGQIGLDGAGDLVFPRLSTAPGVYRITLRTPDGPRIYVGQTENLQRRFAHYRKPGPTQRTNMRINELLRGHLARGSHARLAAADDVQVDGRAADLDIKTARVLVESATLFDLAARGIPVENA